MVLAGVEAGRARRPPLLDHAAVARASVQALCAVEGARAGAGGARTERASGAHSATRSAASSALVLLDDVFETHVDFLAGCSHL